MAKLTCDACFAPQVLHINGMGQRTLSVQFPVLPAGRYLVVWRIRAAPAFLRGEQLVETHTPAPAGM
jgi:hypothetical protein